MASTVTFTHTLAQALQEANPNVLPDALRAYGLGLHLSPQKWTFRSSPGATAWVITGATAAAGASAGPKTPALPQGMLTLPPILEVGTLRVIAGTSAGTSGVPGPYGVTDQGGTAYMPAAAGPSGGQFLAVPGSAILSDDGTTLTFPVAVTGFVLEYIPRSLQDVTTQFEHS